MDPRVAATGTRVRAVEEASLREVEEVEVGGVWMVGEVAGDLKNPKKPTIKMSEAPAKEGSLFDSNRFTVLEDPDEDSEEDVFIGVVENTKRQECGRPTPSKTRVSAMKFHVAKAQRPLASATKIVTVGNRMSMGPKEADNFIEHVHTGERMQPRVERGTYVLDVEFNNGSCGTITLDSEAGVNVWPEGFAHRRADAGSRACAPNDSGQRD